MAASPLHRIKPDDTKSSPSSLRRFLLPRLGPRALAASRAILPQHLRPALSDARPERPPEFLVQEVVACLEKRRLGTSSVQRPCGPETREEIGVTTQPNYLL